MGTTYIFDVLQAQSFELDGSRVDIYIRQVNTHKSGDSCLASQGSGILKNTMYYAQDYVYTTYVRIQRTVRSLVDQTVRT